MLRSKTTRSFYKYHNEYTKFKKKDYLMRIIESTESKKYRLRDLPNEGDEVVKGIIRTLTHLKKITLYGYQLDFAKLVVPTFFKHIYRKDWTNHRDEILDRHGYDEIYDEIFFRAARRTGKTLTLAVIVDALAANVTKNDYRPFIIAVFAVTQPASKRFIDECELAWANIDIRYKYYMTRTSDRIILRNKNDPRDIRIIICYCSASVSYLYFFWRVETKRDERER